VAELMRAVLNRAGWRAALAACALFGGGVAATAELDAGWFEAGDISLRLDLTLLNDAEVIRLPVSHWPLPRAAVRHALANARSHFALNAAVKAALDRVRARVTGNGGRLRLEAGVSGGQAGLLRDIDAVAREDFEITGKAGLDSGRFSASLRATAVSSPDDGQEFRADGSHFTAQFGNWLVSANTLERFWGPSHESSLILSNNARPMPTLMVERATAVPFETRWLHWLGPWRFNFGFSRMENDRRDIDAPLFMAWRVVVMPFEKAELGFSRTAQFCGKQLVCDLNSFGNMIAGNDNVGIDATPENEPGNQMAGFDIRIHSPLGELPYAIYSQMIGEDESSYLPAKFLNQYGIEGWKTFADGGVLQSFAEYSSTTCSGNTSRGPYYDCAYNQGRFSFDGYRYRRRVVGHTTDSDAETWSVGATLVLPRGDRWSVVARTSQLNHDGFDIRNTVSAGPANYEGLEFAWSGTRFGGEKLDLQLGAEAVEPKYGERDIEAFGFLRWTHEFTP
jgi:hypothetical protein